VLDEALAASGLRRPVYRCGVPPEHPLAWLEAHAARRRAAGLRRELRPRPPDEPLLDLAGNDYLGLSRDPRVVAGAVAAVQEWGAGATGSRLVTGTTTLHSRLEAQLATFCHAEGALVFSSGYAANLGVLTALAGPDDGAGGSADRAFSRELQ
jgi:8-amino-7-oxononanoate synthase